MFRAMHWSQEGSAVLSVVPLSALQMAGPGIWPSMILASVTHLLDLPPETLVKVMEDNSARSEHQERLH